MRRKDREISDPIAIENFIEQEQIIRIAFYDDGDIYIVPVNYGFIIEDNKYVFAFHGAKAGRKYELAKNNPVVGFEIDGKYELMPADVACDFSAHFQSVIGTGKLSLIDDINEKEALLNSIMKQTTHSEKWTYSSQMLEAVAVFRLDVEKISCKAK